MPVNRPGNILTPFSNTGVKNTIPESPSATPGEASYETGFPPITMTPKDAGGLPPLGQDMNGVLNKVTQHTLFLESGGIYRFDANIASKYGGYAVGAVLQSDDGLNCYINILAGNSINFNTTPGSIGVSWLFYGPGFNFPLTKNESLAGWKFTGSALAVANGELVEYSQWKASIGGGGGQTFPPSNNLPMGGFKFTGAGPATASGQFLTFDQLPTGGSNVWQNGKQTLTSSGSFTVPAGVTKIYVSGAAGGGGGGAGGSTGGSGAGNNIYNGAGSGAGGGGGQSVLQSPYSVTPGATITVAIGSGGSGGVANTTPGSIGGAGGKGGNTTLSGAVTLTLVGGAAGPGGSWPSTNTTGASAAGGVAAIDSTGTAGSDGTDGNTGGGCGGAGGCSVFGGAGGGRRAIEGLSATPAAASARTNSGSGGGGGGAGYGATIKTGTNGGAGGSGVVIFEW